MYVLRVLDDRLIKVVLKCVVSVSNNISYHKANVNYNYISSATLLSFQSLNLLRGTLSIDNASIRHTS